MRVALRLLLTLSIAVVCFLPRPLLAQPLPAELLQKPWKAQWITGPGQPINRFTATSDLTLKDYGVSRELRF